MVVDKLQLFLGYPVTIFNKNNQKANLHSPLIKEIGEHGEFKYHFNITFATFNKDLVLKMMSEEDTDYLDSFDFLTSNINFIDCVEKSLSFFFKEDIMYNPQTKSFSTKEIELVSKENYQQISDLIKVVNGIKNEEKQLKFRNEKARQMYLKMQELKKQHSKDDGLSLKDILSILCHADGNGINVFNIGDLTIYQVYEHFERMSMKESHKRLLPVWANGYLGDNDKLPEWIEKSKL